MKRNVDESFEEYKERRAESNRKIKDRHGVSIPLPEGTILAKPGTREYRRIEKMGTKKQKEFLDSYYKEANK